MTTALKQYLELEKQLKQVRKRQQIEEEDDILDQMDSLWYQELTAQDRQYLQKSKFRIWFESHFQTWMAETAVVALILSCVTYFTGGELVQWLQTAAVLCTFGYVSVNDRSLERERRLPSPNIVCYRMANIYFVAKEILWAVAFIKLKAYPALGGVAIFLLHKVWRRWWRNRYPLELQK